MLGLSQKQLSERLGVAQAHLSKIESEKGDPSPKLLLEMAAHLNTTPEYLTGADTYHESSVSMPNAIDFDRSAQPFKVKVVGRISAGGVESAQIAVEEVISVIESDKPVDYGLLVKGDSMEPRLFEGDVVLVQRTPVSELRNRDMIVAIVNDEEGLVKRFFQDASGNVILQSDNSNYPPMIFHREQIGIDCLILGKVIEIRAYPGGGL